MSLQDILQKILDEANLEIKKIQQELEQEKKSLFNEFEKEKTAEIEKIAQKKEKAEEKIKQKIESIARREIKQKMLSVRHEVITKALNSFVEYLEKLPDNKYEEVLKKLFAKISGSEGVILAPANRIEVTKKVAPKGFSVEKDDSVKGGFIAKLGKAEVDNTFKNLVFSEFQNEVRSFFAEKLNLI